MLVHVFRCMLHVCKEIYFVEENQQYDFPISGLGVSLTGLWFREINYYNAGGIVTLPRLPSGTTPDRY